MVRAGMFVINISDIHGRAYTIGHGTATHTATHLLRVGEYTVRGSRKRKATKQTVQFKFEDITFFCKNSKGQLKCLPPNALADLIATADGCTLKLDNQKNGCKGVCVFHEANGDSMHCPVRALGRRYLHL
jgi:hypothetical protein